MFTHVNNGITIGMWGKTHCFDVQCKLSRNSMHLSHSVNRVDSQLQPIWFFSKQTLIFNCSFIFSVVILVFVFYPIWLLGIVFLRCMLKARSKTLWLSYSFSSKYSCFPNPSIFFINLLKKIIWWIICLFLRP